MLPHNKLLDEVEKLKPDDTGLCDLVAERIAQKDGFLINSQRAEISGNKYGMGGGDFRELVYVVGIGLSSFRRILAPDHRISRDVRKLGLFYIKSPVFEGVKRSVNVIPLTDLEEYAPLCA